jgi:hypothetical protein
MAHEYPLQFARLCTQRQPDPDFARPLRDRKRAGSGNIFERSMRAVDTSVLVRILARDDPKQVRVADDFVAAGAWVSLLALAVTMSPRFYSGNQNVWCARGDSNPRPLAPEAAERRRLGAAWSRCP